MKTFAEWKYDNNFRHHEVSSFIIDKYLAYAFKEMSKPSTLVLEAEAYQKGRDDVNKDNEKMAERLLSLARKITDPPVVMAIDLVSGDDKYIVSAYKYDRFIERDKAIKNDYGRGRKDGHKAAEDEYQIRTRYGVLKHGEIAINYDNYKRLIRQDEEAKYAYDRGHRAGSDHLRGLDIVTPAECRKKQRDSYTSGVYHGKRQQRSHHASELAAARECALTWTTNGHPETLAIRKLREALGISFNEVCRYNGR